MACSDEDSFEVISLQYLCVDLGDPYYSAAAGMARQGIQFFAADASICEEFEFRELSSSGTVIIPVPIVNLSCNRPLNRFVLLRPSDDLEVFDSRFLSHIRQIILSIYLFCAFQ